MKVYLSVELLASNFLYDTEYLVLLPNIYICVCVQMITIIRVSTEVKYMTAFALWFNQTFYGVVSRNGHSLNRMSGVWDKISTFKAFVLEFCYPVIIINVHAVLI